MGSINTLEQWEADVIAREFYNGSTDLYGSRSTRYPGVYEIEGYNAFVITQKGHMQHMRVSDFVGGVVFALAESGQIPVEHARRTNVEKVSLGLVRLIGANPYPHGGPAIPES